MSLLPLFVSALSLASLQQAHVEANPHLAVETHQGPVRGVLENDIVAFKGIPYAAPPVGDLRWRPPQPPDPWSDTLLADTYGHACPQPIRRSTPEWGREYLDEVGISEDCLTLNVWRPAEQGDESLPVTVYIHGSGWKYAASSWPVWTGENLAREDLVVVNFNYRLGLMGRFAHPALSRLEGDDLLANYNILDQIAVLEWVQENIAEFGGDPNRVTLFGHSAGGVSVNFLMATPRSEGLFHGAIAQGSGVQIDRTRHLSEPGVPGPAEQSLEAIGLDIAEEFGVSGGSDEEIVRRLRAIPADELNAYLKPEIVLNPVVDGDLLPDDLPVLFEKGLQHDVPYITGVSDWEWNQIDNVPLIAKWFLAKPMLAGLDDEDLELFSDQRTRIGLSQQWFNNGVFFVPSRYLAKQMKTVPAAARMYHVTYRQTAIRSDDAFAGAPHGLEVPFLFGHLRERPEFSRPEPVELTAEDFRFGEIVRAYWVNFAKTGDPNGPGLPEWPEFNPDNGRDITLDLGTEVIARDNFKRDLAEHIERRALERRARFLRGGR
ncbi:MAG: carboxylesterase/lipase family protein [Longimicrobiales bacterium]